jgi:hypothetical protein
MRTQDGLTSPRYSRVYVEDDLVITGALKSGPGVVYGRYETSLGDAT